MRAVRKRSALGQCLRLDRTGLFLVEVNRVIKGLLDLPGIEIRQKHLVAEDTGIFVI